MRWIKGEKPHAGDIRVFRRFLFWPKTLVGETRWLEVADIVQEFKINRFAWLSEDDVLDWTDREWGVRLP